MSAGSGVDCGWRCHFSVYSSSRKIRHHLVKFWIRMEGMTQLSISNGTDGTFYVYEDLGGQSALRLIRFNKTRNSYAFSTFMIDDAPPYYALSYCWGETDRSNTLTSDHGTVRVTPHLRL